MTHFDPVIISDDSQCLVIVVVPNACYLKKEVYSGVPDDVATPTGSDYHETIVFSNNSNLEDIQPGDVSFSAVCPFIPDFVHVTELAYNEDGAGEWLWVHTATVDPKTGVTKEVKYKKVFRKMRPR